MKQISLNRFTGIKRFALIDDEDFNRVNMFGWSAGKGNRNETYYAFRTDKSGIKTVRIYMHRFILNALPGSYVDHINHDTLDNRKENMRTGTQSLNLLNRKANRGKVSKYKGVNLYSNGKWVAHYIKQHIGYFTDEKDAALAYNAVAFKANPTWSLLNIIPGYTNEELTTMPRSYAPRIARNKYRGVRKRSEHCYEAYIQHNNSRRVIGYCPTELEAVTAFNIECDKLGCPERKNII